MKTCLCIPTYNNPRTIRQVVSECLAACDLPIMIIDDGSDIAVSELIDRSARVRIFRSEENLGKGAALKQAFSLCAEAGFSHILTLDGDGQHFPSELGKLMLASAGDPSAIVIGARVMEPEKTPFISRLGRRLSNLWIYLLTGVQTVDSQSGMRVYPLAEVGGISCASLHFDFEMEILLRALGRGVNCRAVDVAVHYPVDRVSHFHKVRDNFRIALMNLLFLFRLGLARNQE